METKHEKKKKLHFPNVSSIIRRKLKKKKKTIMVIFMVIIIIIFMNSAFALNTGIRNPPKAGLFVPGVTTTHRVPTECGCPHL
jgi:ascorbate-specific PTS system EIIC-type component UlaA